MAKSPGGTGEKWARKKRDVGVSNTAMRWRSPGRTAWHRLPAYMASSDDLMFRRRASSPSFVRSGDVSARELVYASLERIEALNPALNAFIEVDGEAALEAATRSAGATCARSRACRSRSRPTSRRPGSA